MRLFSEMLVGVFTLALVALFLSSNTQTANALEKLTGGLASWIKAAGSK